MIRRITIGVFTTAALACGIVSTASASTMTVTQAIKAQDKAVHASSAYKQLKSFNISSPAQAKKAIPEFKALRKLVSHAVTAVSAASATSKQEAGKKDWISGAQMLGAGIGDLVVVLTDIADGNDGAAKTEALKADKFAKAGNALGTKGLRLLGLPAND